MSLSAGLTFSIALTDPTGLAIAAPAIGSIATEITIKIAMIFWARRNMGQRFISILVVATSILITVDVAINLITLHTHH